MGRFWVVLCVFFIFSLSAFGSHPVKGIDSLFGVPLDTHTVTTNEAIFNALGNYNLDLNVGGIDFNNGETHVDWDNYDGTHTTIDTFSPEMDLTVDVGPVEVGVMGGTGLMRIHQEQGPPSEH